MGVLNRYARKPQQEKRDCSVGSRIEKSIYDDFIGMCGRLGLKPSEAIRYLIIEELNKNETKKVNEGKQKITELDSKVNQEISRLPNENLLLTDDNEVLTNINLASKKGKGQARNMKEWTVNDSLPCIHCNKWYSLKNFSRHAKKHGYKNGYDMIQSNLEVVEKMVQEKTEG